MKSRFRFQEVDSGRLVYGISPCFVSGSICFFLIFKSFQNFPSMSLFHGSPVLPCRSLYSIGMDFMAVTGVSCRLLCHPYLIAMAAATSASLKPEEGFELKTNKSKTPHHLVPVFRLLP